MMTTLRCKMEPSDGMLLMLVMSMVEHGSMPCDIPAGSDAEQIGTALYAKDSTADACNYHDLAKHASTPACRFGRSSDRNLAEQQAAASDDEQPTTMRVTRQQQAKAACMSFKPYVQRARGCGRAR